MRSHFTFQPHVHQSEGVITPDLLLDRLVLLSAGEEPLTADVERLTSAAAVQYQPPLTVCPDVVLVAAEYGPLLSVGASLVDGDTAANEDAPGLRAHRTSLKLLGRQAWRFADVADHADQLRLRAYLVEGTNRSPLVEDKVSIPDVALQAVSRGDGKPARGLAVFCIGSAVRETPPSSALLEFELVNLASDTSVNYPVQVEPLPDYAAGRTGVTADRGGRRGG